MQESNAILTFSGREIKEVRFASTQDRFIICQLMEWYCCVFKIIQHDIFTHLWHKGVKTKAHWLTYNTVWKSESLILN